MCGIIGYTGNKKANNVLMNGLLSLEYRGYDSAGIAVLESNKITVLKDKGRVKNLLNLDGYDNLTSTCGIAHTRWATHGKPSKENSHPHLDNTNTFAVVHNGIIENYAELRNFLAKNGYKFYSETDTEVIPNLINYYFNLSNSKDKIDTENKVLSAVAKATAMLKGSYAIEVISPLIPDKIIVAKYDSPLVIGTRKGENFIASDIPALLAYTRDFYLLENNDIALISTEGIKFYNNNLILQEKELKNIEWDATSAEKGNFDDFMLKEIFEQPNAIRETIGSRLKPNEPVSFDNLNIDADYLRSVNKIFIVACGTAMHAGLVGKILFEKLCAIPTEVDIASEFRYRDPIIDSNTLCIYVSQSGETADTIAALKLAKSKGAKTLAVTNVIGSSITREADYTVYTHAGPEIAVASTKAYTSQVVLLSILAIHFSELLGKTEEIVLNSDGQKITLAEIKDEIINLPQKISKILENTDVIKKFADTVYTDKDMFFLGRGIDETVAREGSLKLKEISYIHSEAYPSGELKHGPIALIESGIHVITIITDGALAKKSISNIQEVITRGAKVLVITNQTMDNNFADYIYTIPEVCPLLSPVLSVIPLQLLAYYISKNKGLDVDKPRNLAKSVTVE